MGAPAPQMLTANRLRDGDVLYWKAGTWVEELAEGEVFVDKQTAEAALAAAQTSIEDCVVVGTYLFDVRVDNAGVHPVKEREIVRAAGPTVRRDLGKQAPHPPLEGGSKREALRGGAIPPTALNPSPKNPADFSTLPQGEGASALEGFDVSI